MPSLPRAKGLDADVPAVDTSVLREPRFWYSVFASGFSATGPGLPEDLLEATFGTSESDAFSWWEAFTRSHDPTVDASDGYVDDPSTLTFPVGNRVRLLIEYHPGGTYYRLHEGQHVVLLGDLGPHWRLPGLRWAELLAMARAADEGGSVTVDQCLLLLLPLVWAEAGLDVGVQESAVARALENIVAGSKDEATALAVAWASDIRDARSVRWVVGADGPTNDTGNGTRGSAADPGTIRRLNAVIGRATGNTPPTAAGGSPG